MTSLSSHYAKASPRVETFYETRAVSGDADVIEKEIETFIEHYRAPISRQLKNPVDRFYMLKSAWEEATAHLSSITEIAMHPAYQQIIGMGPLAIPYILSEMAVRPGHWFWALKSITGEDPVLPEHRGNLKLMTKAWLDWGRKQGYLR